MHQQQEADMSTSADEHSRRALEHMSGLGQNLLMDITMDYFLFE